MAPVRTLMKIDERQKLRVRSQGVVYLGYIKKNKMKRNKKGRNAGIFSSQKPCVD